MVLSFYCQASFLELSAILLHLLMASAPKLTSQAFNMSIYLRGGQTTTPSMLSPYRSKSIKDEPSMHTALLREQMASLANSTASKSQPRSSNASGKQFRNHQWQLSQTAASAVTRRSISPSGTPSTPHRSSTSSTSLSTSATILPAHTQRSLAAVTHAASGCLQIRPTTSLLSVLSLQWLICSEGVGRVDNCVVGPNPLHD